MEIKNILKIGKKRERKIEEQTEVYSEVAIFDWIEYNKTKLYKIGWTYLFNSNDIEDAFQNSIVKIIEKVTQLKNREFLGTWVTAIFINECRKILKDRKRYESIELHAITDNSSCREEDIDLINGIEKLQLIDREPLILKYFSGYSQEEISKILGIPVGTVKSRIYRGIVTLRSIVKEVE